jgi:hypothetical protein
MGAGALSLARSSLPGRVEANNESCANHIKHVEMISNILHSDIQFR